MSEIDSLVSALVRLCVSLDAYTESNRAVVQALADMAFEDEQDEQAPTHYLDGTPIEPH